MAEMEKIHATIPGFLRGIWSYYDFSEKFYFRSRSKSLALIAKTIGQHMKFDDKRIAAMVQSSFFLSAIQNSMPAKFILTDPDVMNQEDSKAFFTKFSIALKEIRKSGLKLHTRILAELWENYDGSGHPRGLKGTELLNDSQILNIANIYQNNVYRLNKDELDKYTSGEIVVQSKAETVKRHDAAMKYINNKVKWFDPDVFQEFQFILKSKFCAALIPETNDLRIEFNKKHKIYQPKEKPVHSPQKSEEAADPGITESAEQPEEISDEERVKDESTEQVESKDVAVGMKIAEDVLTDQGMMIVKKDSILDEKFVKNIKYLSSTGMFSGKVTIYKIDKVS